MNTNITTLINTKCELMVSPTESLYDPGFTYLEFVAGEDLDLLSTAVISEDPELFRHYFEKDGLYVYYRLKIATTQLDELNTQHRLYFDDITKKLMIGDDEVTESSQLEDVIDDDSPNTSWGIIDIIEEPIFSICRISRCLENLQRKYIFNETHFVGKCKDDSDKNLRDFLFSSVFILKMLIRQQRYEEALKILNTINTCGMCDSYINSKNSCNCK